MKMCCAFLLIAGCGYAQTGKSKDALSAAQQAAVVESVRQYAIHYTRNLPNYTCKLNTRQSIHNTSSVNQPALRIVNIEEQLSLAGNREIHKTQRIDGVPVAPDAGERVPGTSTGEFGNLLATIFETKTGADIRFDRTSTLSGHRVDMLAFSVPQPSGYILTESNRLTRVPFGGTVYADAETHAVLRIHMRVSGIPAASQYQSLELTVDYKPARIAGAEYILPSHFELNLRTDRMSQQTYCEYTNYRRFSAETTVIFDDN